MRATTSAWERRRACHRSEFVAAVAAAPPPPPLLLLLVLHSRLAQSRPPSPVAAALGPASALTARCAQAIAARMRRLALKRRAVPRLPAEVPLPLARAQALALARLALARLQVQVRAQTRDQAPVQARA